MIKNFTREITVTPLPVFIIATYDENGVPNAMNAGWATQSDFHEITFFLSKHKTTDNIIKNQAFTVSLATVDTLEISDYFGIETGRRVNKIEKAGVHVTKSELVNAPIIEEYPLTLECEVKEIRELNHDYQIIGKVLNMRVDDSVLTDDKVDMDKLKPLCFDSATRTYRVLGGIEGKAFSAGKKIK